MSKKDGDEEYTPKGVNFTLPVRYFIFPVTSGANWEGTPTLQGLQRQVEKTDGKHCYGIHTTMRLPQLRHNPKSDNIALMQVGSVDYARYKKFLGANLIEAGSLSELFDTFGELLPEEPPSVKLSPPVNSLLSRVPDGPMSGILVVAFDQQIAGSLASEELARAGATVIKVEKKEGGDPKRKNSTHGAFNTFNAGKFSITFDDTEEDRKLKADILAKADVIIDNRSEKAQLRDTVLQNALQTKGRKKPAIFCSISGFGRGTGIPAYDRAVQAATGMAEMNGKLISFPVIDMATGKEAAKEIANYLLYRERMDPLKRKATPCIRIDISMAATGPQHDGQSPRHLPG